MTLIRHDSRLRLFWGLALIPGNLVFGTVLSYHILFGMTHTDWFYWVMQVVMWADLGMDFVTTRKHRRVVLTDFKSVASCYLRGWMVVDLLAAIPFEYFAERTGMTEGWFTVFRVLPLLKTFKVSTVLSDLQDHLHLNPAMMRLTSFGYWVMQGLHAISLGWVWVGGSPSEIDETPSKTVWVIKEGRIEQESTPAVTRKFTHFEVYLRAAYWTVTTVGTIGYGDYSPSKDNNLQITYAMLVELVGVSVYGFVVGNIPGLIANRDAAKAAFVRHTGEVNEFMRLKSLPIEIQQRVREYYEYLWETRHNISDTKVLGDLPHSLSLDVLIFLNREILQKVEFFQNANEIFIREIVKMFTTEVFLPGDFIIRQGEFGDCMYFLSNGSAEVLVGDNKVATLGAGSPFGEMALISGDKRTASIRAVSYCDVYCLQREAFERLRSRYPEFDARVVQIMEERANSNKKS